MLQGLKDLREVYNKLKQLFASLHYLAAWLLEGEGEGEKGGGQAGFHPSRGF